MVDRSPPKPTTPSDSVVGWATCPSELDVVCNRNKSLTTSDSHVRKPQRFSHLHRANRRADCPSYIAIAGIDVLGQQFYVPVYGDHRFTTGFCWFGSPSSRPHLSSPPSTLAPGRRDLRGDVSTSRFDSATPHRSIEAASLRMGATQSRTAFRGDLEGICSQYHSSSRCMVG